MAAPASPGSSSRSWENEEENTDVQIEKAQMMTNLMVKLNNRAAHHKNWDENIKAMKMAVMDKRQKGEVLERSHIQSCLDKLQLAIKVVNQQSLQERLKTIARQLDLKFSMSPVSEDVVVICSEMFRIEITMANHGTVKDVRIGHIGEPSSCEDLTEVLSKGNFDLFTQHLQGLQDIYNIPGDKKLKSKAYLALNSLETDLNHLAQLQSSFKGVSNCIHKSPLGLLLPRKGGCPMKLIYFVSPYDLLDKKTKTTHPMTVEAITENELGQSVNVCIEKYSHNKLQTIPLMSTVKQEYKSIPRFQGLSSLNSCTLNACFVLMLPQPIPVAMSIIKAIKNVTNFDVVTCSNFKPLLSLVQQNIARKLIENEEFFVTLPDQQHVYYMKDISGNSLNQPAAMVTRIPFTHPTHVELVLNLLRQQLMFNTVIGSCVRPNAKKDLKSSVVFELASVSLESITIMFEHPLQDTMVTADIELSDITDVTFKVCIGEDGSELCSDEVATKIFQRCLSIPVTLRSVINKVSEQLRREPTPEPVPSPIEIEKYTWSQSIPPPPPYAAGSFPPLDIKMSPSLNLPFNPVTSPPLGLKPGRGGVPAALVTPDSADGDKPSSNPLLATLLDQDSPSPESPPVNETPMLTKLLGDETSTLASSIPAPPTQKTKKSVKRRSRDSISMTGRSPKHRLSESESLSVDLVDSTSLSFDASELSSSIGGMSNILPSHMHGRMAGSMRMDLTSPDSVSVESPMKKLENTLVKMLPEDQHHQMSHQPSHQNPFPHQHFPNPNMHHSIGGAQEMNMMLSDIHVQKDVASLSTEFYGPSSVQKNEKESTSLEAILKGSREVLKTKDPIGYANSQHPCGEHKELSELLRQNSSKNAQNQHSSLMGEASNTLGYTVARGGSTSCSPIYSEMDTSHDSNSSKSCENGNVYNSSAITNSVLPKEVNNFSLTNQVSSDGSSALGLQPKDIRVDKNESSLRTLLSDVKREKFDSSMTVGSLHVKHEPRNLKLTLSKRNSTNDSSPSPVLDCGLNKSRSTETFEFNSDDEDSILPLDKKRSLTLQKHRSKPNSNKLKKKDSKHFAENSKRKKDKYDTKKDKKKRKMMESVSSESSEEAPVYTATAVETEVKCENIKLKFIKSGGKLSTESSPNTSSPASVNRDKSDTKKHLKDSNEKADGKIRAPGQKSHKHNRSFSSSSITVNRSDSKLMTKTPTIKLKPIPMSSVNVSNSKNSPINSQSGKSPTVPTSSAVIGRIAALSSPISANRTESMTPPHKATTPTGIKTPPVGKSPTSLYSSKSLPSSTSGRNAGSNVRSATPTGRLSGSYKNSNGPLSNVTKLFAGDRKGGSPSLSGSKSSQSSKSASALAKNSTSTTKASATSASNVLSFLKTNASGIASLPPIPKRSSSSGAPNKTSSTPLTTPAPITTNSYTSVNNAVSVSKPQSGLNSALSTKSSMATGTHLNTAKQNMVKNNMGNKPSLNTKSINPSLGSNPRTPVSSPNINSISKGSGSSPNINVSKNPNNSPNINNLGKSLTGSPNINNGSHITKGVLELSASKPSHLNLTDSPIRSVNSHHLDRQNSGSMLSSNPSANFSTLNNVENNTTTTKTNTTLNAAVDVSRKMSVTSSESGGVSGANTPTKSSPTACSPTLTSTLHSSSALNSAFGAKARPRKSSLSAVIDKLTKSSGQHTPSVVDGPKSHCERVEENDLESRSFTDKTNKDINAGGHENDAKKSVGFKRSFSASHVPNEKKGWQNQCSFDLSQTSMDGSDSKSATANDLGGKGLTNSKDSRNLFTSLLANPSVPHAEDVGENVVSVEGSGDNSATGSNKSVENNCPSPAKKPRTHSPKIFPSKFNGDMSKDGDVLKDSDIFKVPTPKNNGAEEKDSEDTENLVVRKKSRINTSKPVLSPASPVSSPEQNLIIDCQTLSPCMQQNKVNSPQLLTEESIKIRAKNHTPSPKVKNSPVNSPVSLIHVSKEHSNPNSVKSHPSPSSCEIDDDLMNDAIVGFGS